MANRWRKKKFFWKTPINLFTWGTKTTAQFSKYNQQIRYYKNYVEYSYTLICYKSDSLTKISIYLTNLCNFTKILYTGKNYLLIFWFCIKHAVYFCSVLAMEHFPLHHKIFVLSVIDDINYYRLKTSRYCNSLLFSWKHYLFLFLFADVENFKFPV